MEEFVKGEIVILEFPFSNLKEDFQKGKLKVDSYLRIDKIFSIEKSLIRYKIGLIKKEKFNEIINNICSFLKS